VVAVPKFALPFRAANGMLVVNEQDSLADVATCVTILLATPRGTRLELPDYGIGDPLFTTSLDTAEIAAQLARYEPRAAAMVGSKQVDQLAFEVEIAVSTIPQERRS
jgi:phage baseplate assembly protein W